MELLPPDVLPFVCASLTGFDVLRLSQTSAWLRRATSSTRIWRRFFDTSTLPLANAPAPADEQAAIQKVHEYKERYVRSRSLQFRGLLRASAERFHHDHGAFVVVREQPRVPRLWPSTSAFTQNFGRLAPSPSVSLDAWFSLRPASASTIAGGVLFGLQSAPVGSSIWPHYHEQPVLVTPDHQLFCSLLEPQEVDTHAGPVRDQLDVHRWYHLALTYSGHDRLERVFLDGELVATRTGNWLRHWRHLVHCQVGTGCVTADDRGSPEPEHLGWYGLHGTVDEFRIWESALSAAQVQQLASGRELEDEELLWFSLRDGDARKEGRSGVSPVRCTRPSERTFEMQ